MKNKKVRKMIHYLEISKRNGCIPLRCLFTFKDGDFGYWVPIESGWFFRGVYYGVVSLTSDQLSGN